MFYAGVKPLPELHLLKFYCSIAVPFSTWTVSTNNISRWKGEGFQGRCFGTETVSASRSVRSVPTRLRTVSMPQAITLLPWPTWRLALSCLHELTSLKVIRCRILFLHPTQSTHTYSSYSYFHTHYWWLFTVSCITVSPSRLRVIFGAHTATSGFYTPTGLE